MKSDEVFQLGTFQFERCGPTLRDKDGVIVQLRHQSLKVLGCLCGSAGAIVTKADLNEQVWGDTFVTDASLVQCIREIRRALHDDDLMIVKTFPRQGYMIETTVAATVDRRSDSGTPVIAVCQFQDHSMGVDRHVLSDAIAEDLIVALSRYPELSVVSRQASFGFEVTENRTEQIVERTGAQYIMTGYQQKLGQKLRVAVALIDAKSDKNIWTESYVLDASDLFGAQSEVVGNIATAVDFLIPNFALETGGAGKAAALGYHFKAIMEFTKFTETSLKRAEELGRKAVEADPTSPYGYQSLCFINLCRHEFGFWNNRPGEELAAAEVHAEMGITLAPNSPNAVMTRGCVFMAQGRLEDALACFEKTIQLNPNHSANRMNYAETLALTGDISAALEQVELARKRNSVRPNWHYINTSFILWAAGQNEEAIKYLRNVPDLPPTSIPFKCALLASNGEVKAAKAEMAKLVAERPNHTLEVERFVAGKKFRDTNLLGRWLAALELAGMPEYTRETDN